jgi:hypothetical protein
MTTSVETMVRVVVSDLWWMENQGYGWRSVTCQTKIAFKIVTSVDAENATFRLVGDGNQI